jgi:hypothetical protein
MFRFASILILFTACAADVGDTDTNPNPGSDPNNPSKPDDPSNPTPGGSMTAAEFLTAMGKKDCDDAFTCKANFPTDAGVTFPEAFGADVNACYTDAASYYNATAVQAAITAGKIAFDGTAAKACVDGFKAPTCTTYWTAGPDFVAACDTAMVGKVATGGACTIDFECAGENWCDDTTKKCAAIPAGQLREDTSLTRYARLRTP